MRTWDIQRSVFTVGDFVQWAGSGTLELSPAFQRRPVWPKKAKSYLIDTVVNGLPMPVIFLRDRTDLKTIQTIREVVDGQQRLRTIISFVAPDYLSDFNEEKDRFQVLKTHNKEIADQDFDSLSSDIRERILSYQFSVDVLPSDTDDSDVLKIFARMNSTGTKLNYQELRNAEFFGVFKGECYDTALQQIDRWKDWGIFKDEQLARMLEVELTSELLIYLMDGLQSKTQSAIDNVYRKFDDDFPQNKIIRRFNNILDLIDEIIGDDLKYTIFHRPTLFYSFFAAVNQTFPDGNKSAKGVTPKKFRDKAKLVSDRIEDRSAPDIVIEATQRRLGHRGSREAVLKYLLQNINRK